MPLEVNPPIQDSLLNNGKFPQTWVLWFNAVKKMLKNDQPWNLPSYTVAGVPTASDWESHIIYVSNESGGKTLAFSDGVNWRRVQDRAIIS